ncbi:MAG: hypothetical protein E2O85_05680 [Bacteroidetes bacterium]|nr:MAG: hypothetical protein E2O85_05680 [Bacteroidota bacterium]
MSPFTEGRFLWVDSSEIRFRDLTTQASTPLGKGGRVLYASVSPDRLHAVLAVESGSESRLIVFSVESLQSVELRTGSASLQYTGSWSPDGSRFAVGYYEPTVANDRPAMGTGDIEIISLDDHAVRRLGCSSSKAVISWPSSNELVVRSTDNLYRVSETDCGTLQTTDIRRWTAITPSPDGRRLAYTFRELAFNSATREYEPDSALFVVSVTDGDPVKIAGDRYRPRHATWSPDGSEIAFDVRVEPESELRSISIYRLTTEETAYAFSPSASAPSKSHPEWNSDSQTLSYREDGERLFIQTPGTSFSTAVTVGDARSYANRLVGWLSSTTALVSDSSELVWMFDTASQALEFVGSGTAIPF